MSNNIPGPEFWQRVDAVVNVANDQCDAATANEVAASTLFAAARFNAFLLAKGTGNADSMKGEREEALEYFMAQFRGMMSANLDDFIANFDTYIQPDPQ